MGVKTALLAMFTSVGGGGLPDASATDFGVNIASDILIETRVHMVAEKLTAPDWLLPGCTHRELRHTAR